MLRSTSFHAVLSGAALWWMTAIYWQDFPTFTYPSAIWLPQWGDFLELSGSYLVCEKNGWATIWWSHVMITLSLGHNTSMWQTERQFDRHRKCSTYACRAEKSICVLAACLHGACHDSMSFTNGRLQQMHELQGIVTNDLVKWHICQSVCNESTLCKMAERIEVLIVVETPG